MKHQVYWVLKMGVIAAGAVVGWLCLFWLLPLSFEMADIYSEFVHLQYPLLMGMYLTTVPFFRGVVHAFRYLRDREQDKPFQTRMISLKTIQRSALQIILLYVMGMIFLAWQGALHQGVWLLGMGIIFVSALISYGAELLR